MNLRYQPKKNRRLLLTLAFLLLDIHSEHTSLNYDSLQLQSNSNKSLINRESSSSTPSSVLTSSSSPIVGTGNIVWLVDKDSGTCLGDMGFSECSDVNLWKSHSVDSDTLQFESVISHLTTTGSISMTISESQGNNDFSSCLGRKVNSEHVPSAVESQSCNQNIFKHGYTNWKYDADTGRISSHSWFETPHCLFRDNNLNTVLILPCEEGYTSFYPIHYDGHFDAAPSSGSSESVSSTDLSRSLDEPAIVNAPVNTDPDTWTCPTTKLVLPRIIDRPGHAPLTVVAGDVYLKTVMGINFRVYTIAWYVDARMAYSDPAMAPFLGKSAAELASSEAFYEAMVHPGANYDRAATIKLNMGLNMEDVIKGLSEELGLLPANSIVFERVLQEYKKKSPKCEKGLEIVFRWRAADSVKHTSEYLEISIRGQVQAELHEPGIARDFFVKFVNDFPVSPMAKTQFPVGFAALLSQPPVNIEQSSTVNIGATSATIKPRESKRARLKKFLINMIQSPKEKVKSIVAKVKSIFSRPSTTPGASTTVLPSTPPTSTSTVGTTQSGRRKSFHAFLQSIMIRRWNSPVFEAFVTAFIILNAIIMIMISLPPARSFVRRQTARAESMIRRARVRILNSISSLKRAHSADSFRRPKRVSIPPCGIRVIREAPTMMPVSTCIRRSMSHSCLAVMKNM